MKKKVIVVMMAAMLVSTCVFAGCGEKSDTQKTSVSSEKQVSAEPEISAEQEQPEQEIEPQQPVTEKQPVEEEKEKEEMVLMYTLTNLVLRAEGSKEAEKLDILPVNTEVKVLKKDGEWYQVEAESQNGYVYGEYLTEDKEKAEQAKADADAKAKAEAQAKAKAAAEAAAKAASQKSESNKKDSGDKKDSNDKKDSKDKNNGKKTEVSRENFDDCDNSGHGYTEIHYSDGSVEIVEY